MDSRFVATLLAVAVLLAPLAFPGAVASDTAVEDATSAVGGDVDAASLDRLRAAAVAWTEPWRVGERTSPLATGTADGRSAERTSRRSDPDGMLEQSTRAAVYDAVVASPGGTLSEFARAVDVSKSTVRYHARLLRGAGLVAATEVGGALRYAPTDADVELAAALRADGTGAVLAAVAEREPASVSALAAATDRAPSTVSHHLATLEERGLVVRERSGEAVVTTLAPSIRTAVATEPREPADD